MITLPTRMEHRHRLPASSSVPMHQPLIRFIGRRKWPSSELSYSVYSRKSHPLAQQLAPLIPTLPHLQSFGTISRNSSRNGRQFLNKRQSLRHRHIVSSGRPHPGFGSREYDSSKTRKWMQSWCALFGIQVTGAQLNYFTEWWCLILRQTLM